MKAIRVPWEPGRGASSIMVTPAPRSWLDRRADVVDVPREMVQTGASAGALQELGDRRVFGGGLDELDALVSGEENEDVDALIGDVVLFRRSRSSRVRPRRRCAHRRSTGRRWRRGGARERRRGVPGEAGESA